MKKYILVARRDETNPYAVEAKLKFESDNGESLVVVVNVPEASYIPPGLLQVKSNLNSGKARAEREGYELVLKLARLANDKNHRMGASDKLITTLSEALEYPELDKKKLMVVCE